MAFIAVGDFDMDKIEKRIKTRFGKLQNPPNEKPRTKFPVPLHDNTIISIAGDKELQFQMAGIIFERPKEKTATVADFRRNLSEKIYDAMLNDRYQELTQKGNPPFTFAGVNDGQFIGGINAFSSFAILKPDGLEKGLSAQLEELYRVKQNGFTQTELDRQKEKMMTEMEKNFSERDKTESVKYVGAYVQNFLEGRAHIRAIEYENDLYKKYLSGITLAEVNALSAKRMDGKSRVVTVSSQMKDRPCRSYRRMLRSEPSSKGIDSRNLQPMMIRPAINPCLRKHQRGGRSYTKRKFPISALPSGRFPMARESC